MTQRLSIAEYHAINKRKPSKHRSVKTMRGALKFDSKWEAECWDVLQRWQSKGMIKHLQRQVSFPLTVDGVKVQTYRADFWYEHPTNGLIIADAKSAHTASLNSWKRTKSLMLACYGITVAEIIGRASR